MSRLVPDPAVEAVRRPVVPPEHIALVVVEQAHRQAFGEGKARLRELLNVEIPQGWPHFPSALLPSDKARNPRDASRGDWPGFLFIHAPERTLVGNGGFKAPPDRSGIVEIGYEIASEHWGRGMATAVVERLLSFAFDHPEVRGVEAHTLAEENASNRVLRKVGMEFAGDLKDSRVGRVWRWRIAVDSYRNGKPR